MILNCLRRKTGKKIASGSSHTPTQCHAHQTWQEVCPNVNFNRAAKKLLKLWVRAAVLKENKTWRQNFIDKSVVSVVWYSERVYSLNEQQKLIPAHVLGCNSIAYSLFIQKTKVTRLFRSRDESNLNSERLDMERPVLILLLIENVQIPPRILWSILLIASCCLAR